MKFTIRYETILGEKCAIAKVNGETLTAAGDTWTEAKAKVVAQIRRLKDQPPPPPDEMVEIL